MTGENGNGYGPRLTRVETRQDHIEGVIGRMGADVARIDERQAAGQQRAEAFERRTDENFAARARGSWWCRSRARRTASGAAACVGSDRRRPATSRSAAT